MWKPFLLPLLLATIVFLPHAPASAQSAQLGEIAQLLRGLDRQRLDSTPNVRLTAPQRYTNLSAADGAPLHDGELVAVREDYFVWANLRHRATETGVYARGESPPLGELPALDHGVYRIRRGGPEQLGDLEVVVHNGVVGIRCLAGSLLARVGLTEVQCLGTTLLVSADSSSTEAYLFLREGHIRFPEYDIEVEGEEDVLWRLRDGLPPEQLTVGAATLSQLRTETDYLTDGVWQPSPRPLWQRPEFLVPAVAVAAVGTCAILGCFSTDPDPVDDGPFDGIVIVRLP